MPVRADLAVKCDTASRTSFPAFGSLVFVLALVAIGEDVYEETVLTWQRGPQMVGYSIAHLHPFLLMIGSASILLLHLWLAWFVFRSALRSWRRQKWKDRQRTVLAVVSAVLLGFLYIPYPWWTSFTLWVAGPGPRAQDQLASAALQERQGLVDMLLSRGVLIDGKDQHGDTALEAACSNYHKSMADLLAKRGASLDTAPACRQYSDFAARMKPRDDANQGDRLIKIPGTTVEVESGSGSRLP